MEQILIAVDAVVIEPKTWKVWKNGNELKLPNREFELLRFLAENPNIVFSKEELFEKDMGIRLYFGRGDCVCPYQPAEREDRGRRAKAKDHRDCVGRRIPSEYVK